MHSSQIYYIYSLGHSTTYMYKQYTVHYNTIQKSKKIQINTVEVGYPNKVRTLAEILEYIAKFLNSEHIHTCTCRP